MPKNKKYDYLEQLLTVEKVAKHLGIPARTIQWQLIHGHLVGAHKVGAGKRGIWLIPPTALKRYVPPPKGRPAKKVRGKK